MKSYFGGKSAVADIVWQYLGDVKHYIEPFFGSGAVLLARPDYDPMKHLETVCDLDGHLANVWRSLQHSPDEVAKWCDWPVNHADMYARRKVLMENEGRLLKNLVEDDMCHDPKLAGYWIWLASCWIGGGMFDGTETRIDEDGIIGQRPHLSGGGVGVHKQSLVKKGISAKRPDISCGGKGVHKLSLIKKGVDLGIPQIAHGGKGVNKPSLCFSSSPNRHVTEPYIDGIYIWFRQLSERLRRVRVVCGSWERVCGGDWQDDKGVAGIFLDPPYGVKANRDSKLYHQDSLTVADDVRKWALERGKRETYRIVLAGYYEEHEELLGHGWRVERWIANGGYSNSNKKGNDNKTREALFISPYCLRVEKQATLL